MIRTSDTTIEVDEVTFGEFSRVCDLVENYFGETITDVALHAAVSKRQLVAVLARAQLSGRALPADGRARDGVVYQSDRETLCWLETGFWNELRGRHDLTAAETRAAQRVHRRIVEAVDGGPPADRRECDPFVLVEDAGATARLDP